MRLAAPRAVARRAARTRVALRLARGGERERECRLSCDRWGAYVLGELCLRAHDRFGALPLRARLDRRCPLKVYPREEVLRGCCGRSRRRSSPATWSRAQKGEGIEFADLRQFVPGDRVRRINWRASARRGELWVNELHAERNTDVVLFLDSFAEAAPAGRVHARPRRARRGRARGALPAPRTASASSASAACSTGCCLRRE